jgi:putative ABC transport system permease protein
MQRIVADLRSAIRSLARAPGYTAVAVAVLGFGIGVSVAALAIGNRALLTPLPYTDPDRLITLFEATPSGGARLASRPTVADWRAQARSFESFTYVSGTQLLLKGDASPELVTTALPSGRFFGLLGSRAALGRTISPDDDERADRVVVLAEKLWRRRFGARADILGHRISLGDGEATVIGVMPEGFKYPEWAEAWMPESTAPASLRRELESRTNHADSRTIGRLKAGVTAVAAQTELDLVAARLAQAYPDDSREWTKIGMIPMPQYGLTFTGSGTGQSQTPRIALVVGAALLVLTLGGANVATLGLVRGLGRARELAVRAALGASRGDIARLMLLESLALALMGAALGAALAGVIVRLTQRWNAELFPRLAEIEVNGWFVVTAVVLAIVVALLSGLVPALRATPRSLNEVLGGARGQIGGGRTANRLQAGLIVGQVAVAVVLLVGAGLLLKSLERVVTVDVGIDVPRLSSIYLYPPADKYSAPDRLAAFYRGAIDAVRRVPGVQSVAFVNHLPLSAGSIPTAVTIVGRETPTDQPDLANFKTISPEYFVTAGIPIVRGRGYADADLAGPNGSLVVNQAFADRYWPGQDPIGQRVTVYKSARWLADYGQPLPSTVIGVVGNVRHFGPETNPPQEVYLPYTWNLWRFGGLVIRSTVPPEDLAMPVDRALLALEPDLPVAADQRFRPYADLLVDLRGPRRLLTVGLGGLAAAALGIAMVGLYALLAYSVTRRRPELGIRAALGANRGRVLRLVLAQGLTLTSVGLGIGLAVALGVSRLLSGIVFGISTHDALVFGLVPLVLLSVALAAVYWPARRAAAVDPVETLR